MANNSADRVIVIDDSDSDEETSSRTKPEDVSNSSKKQPVGGKKQPVGGPSTLEVQVINDDSSSSVQNMNHDVITERVRRAIGPTLIEIDITDKTSCKVVSKDDEKTQTDDDLTCLSMEVAKKLTFDGMLKIIRNATEPPPIKHRNKNGPVCCNSWCENPANIVPEPHIRDYYNIPSGNSFKVCDNCLKSYYNYVEKLQKGLKNGGNVLEGLSRHVNEFIVLDQESDEDDEEDEGDPETERLLSNAIGEVVTHFRQEVGLDDIVERTINQMSERLEKFIEDGSRTVSVINKIESDLYKSTEAFKCTIRPMKIISLPELDIPIDESVETERMILSDGFEDESSMDDSDVPEPDNLPPFGEFTRPPPQVGDLVYAMKEYSYSEWVPFKIADIIYDCDEKGVFQETFNLETTEKGAFLKRVVNSDCIARMEVPEARLSVGSRVIGAFEHNERKQKIKMFLSGMIAEFPTSTNRFRYLVFFENGKAQYCLHEEVKLVYKSLKKIQDYFTGFHSNFIQTYLKNYPDRPMVRTKIDHFVRVEVNGFWISGQVDCLDGSLAHVIFPDSYSEWIYRGSPRLRPVYDRLQASLVNLPSGSGVRRTRLPSKRQPGSGNQVVHTQIIIDSSDDDENSSSQPSRAVAKKSTSRPIQAHHVQNSGYFRYLDKRSTRSSVIRKLPLIMLNPNTFHYHKCSRVCVTWVKYSEDKTHGVHPLAIPSIFAFKRDIDVTSAVTYTVPCGKKLKNIQEVLKYLSETFIPLTLDMFDFDIRTQIFDEYVVAPQYVIMEDISFGSEKNAIACVNEVDSDCPDLMQYMTERRPLEGVNMNLDPNFLICCDCEDNCRDRSKCRCWRLTIDCYKPFNIGEEKRHITKIGYQYQRLDQNLLSGVYECNSNCRCNTVTCINRVVQHPTRHKLQLFKTPKKGWGTRCLNDIPQGVFICTYVGNILTEPAANETGTINGDEYFAELDHIEVMEESKADFEAHAANMTDEDDSMDESSPKPTTSRSGRALRSSAFRKHKHGATSPTRRNPKERLVDSDVDANSDDDKPKDSVRRFYGPDETVYVMDAKIAGNIGRYFNHSCDPNIFVQNVYVDTHDLRFPWVAFFALKHIPAGTELTWDYGYKIGSVPGKVLYCHCGSHNCRKRLL